MILLIDNYDSFVHNLARYVSELGFTAVVRRNDAIALSEVAAMAPTHIVLSPGPCTPDEAGICNSLVRHFDARIPIFGVCLGQQCIGAAYGGRIVRARRPLHGAAAPVHHDGTGVLRNVPTPFSAARYHSLVIDPATLPDELVANAWSDEGEIMSVTHRSRSVYGVQFHPESVATEWGYRILGNFLGVNASQGGGADMGKSVQAATA